MSKRRSLERDSLTSSSGRGSTGRYMWEVHAALEPSGNPRRPCIEVVSETDSVNVCGSVDPVPLLLAHSVDVPSGQRTALGMVFLLRVGSVRLWLAAHRSRRIWLKVVTLEQARTLGLERFGYATRAFAGRFCLRRFATYSRSGDHLTTSPKTSCPST